MLRFSQSPVAIFVIGLVVLLAGLGTAVSILPEWEVDPLPPEEIFREKADEVVQDLGLRKLDEFQITLTDDGISGDNPQSEREQLERFLGDRASAWLAENERTFYVLARSQVENRDGKPLTIELKYTLGAELVSLNTISNEIGAGALRGSAISGVQAEEIVAALVREGEKIGEQKLIGFFGSDIAVYPILNLEGDFVESVRLLNTPNFPLLNAERIPATTEQIDSITRDISAGMILTKIWGLATRVAFGIGLVALVVALAAQRSLGLKNGLILGAVQFLLVIPPVISGQQHFFVTLAYDLLFLCSAFVVFIGWSASESWYRILSNETTTGLDHLRERILGKAEGRSLVAGWGLGALLAGILLIAFAVASRVGWITATDPSVDISALFHARNPWFSGVMVTIAVLLAYGVGAKLFPADRRFPITLAVATFLLAPLVGITPFPVTIVLALLIAAVLLWALENYRLLGLMTASLMVFSLPVAAFSLIHPAWQPLELMIAGTMSIAPIAFGFVGLGREETEGREKVATPTFLRRLEHERRLRYEMDLLARMQLGLLPGSPPLLKNWQIAVRSVLPTEVGGDFYEFITDEDGCLWVAMGDVSGHGYQCSIAHAMTKAALLSLVSGRLRPAAIMNRLDQVLRQSGTARTFVALALMKIDLESGEVVFSNAASPYPVLLTAEGMREIEISTLPLGHGPVQTYENYEFTMEPGSAIVFWSDGLYEARNPQDDEYGYERPSNLARSRLDERSDVIMEAIFSDWDRFRNGADVEDDTTVLVMKRA